MEEFKEDVDAEDDDAVDYAAGADLVIAGCLEDSMKQRRAVLLNTLKLIPML